MALFYPAAFGIVGQKMTTLQHRSQGDPEDPHDEHYLLSTQSKQDQVHTSSLLNNRISLENCPMFFVLKCLFLIGAEHFSVIFFLSVLAHYNNLYLFSLFSHLSLLNPWKGRVFLSLLALRVNPAAKDVTRQREETKMWSSAIHRERLCRAGQTQKKCLLFFCPGSQQ